MYHSLSSKVITIFAKWYYTWKEEPRFRARLVQFLWPFSDESYSPPMVLLLQVEISAFEDLFTSYKPQQKNFFSEVFVFPPLKVLSLRLLFFLLLFHREQSFRGGCLELHLCLPLKPWIFVMWKASTRWIREEKGIKRRLGRSPVRGEGNG